MDRKGKDRRPRSRSSLLAEKLASFGPDAGDFKEPETYPYYDYRRNEGKQNKRINMVFSRKHT